MFGRMHGECLHILFISATTNLPQYSGCKGESWDIEKLTEGLCAQNTNGILAVWFNGGYLYQSFANINQTLFSGELPQLIE